MNILVTCIKNYTPLIIEQLGKLAVPAYFDEVVVVSKDSKDLGYTHLKQNFTILNFNPYDKSLKRAIYMAKLRNIYLKYLQDKLNQIDIVCIFDSDIVLDSYDVHQRLQLPCHINALFCNGLSYDDNGYYYYDNWTYIQDNCNTLFEYKMKKFDNFPKMIKVNSAFGGIGIYRASCLQNKRYRPHKCINGYGSEHTGLNMQISNKFIDTTFKVIR